MNARELEIQSGTIAPNGGIRRAIHTLADVEDLERHGLDAVVPIRSTHELLCRAARLHGQRPAFVYLPTGAVDDTPSIMNFEALLASVNRAANLFRSLGVGREDTVALLLPTMPETLSAFFGAQAAGRVCPINYMLSAEHAAELIDHSGAKVLVALGPDPEIDIWSKILEIHKRSARLEHLIAVGAPADAGIPDYARATADQPPELTFEPRIGRDDIAAFFHTGGTTGLPKLVRHTHANEVHVSWFGGMFYDIGPDDLVVNGFPLFHVAGAFVLAGSAIAAGAATLIPSRLGMRSKPFVKDYWQVIERYGATLLSGGPTFVSTLLGRPADDVDLSGVKALFGGGSPMPAGLASSFETRFGIPVRSIYGMTEAAGMISAVPRHAERRQGSSGWRLPFSDVAVFAPDDEGRPDPGRPMERGAHGLLAIRGANVSPGYSDDRISAAQRLPEGWLATGDTGRIDPDGQVVVLGRSKDVIIRGGHNIDPLVIEEALMRHPEVELCAAVGQPDLYAGELPVAFLKLKPSSAGDPWKVLESVRGHIPEPAAVPKHLYLLDDIPLTTTGKVFKPALRRLAVEYALRQQLGELLPDGSLVRLACHEELGQRRVEIALAPEDEDENRLIVNQHMSRLSFPFEFVAP
ncbi:MAG: AMP-binding protein [Rhizobiaceae bacterium]